MQQLLQLRGPTCLWNQPHERPARLQEAQCCLCFLSCGWDGALPQQQGLGGGGILQLGHVLKKFRGRRRRRSTDIDAGTTDHKTRGRGGKQLMQIGRQFRMWKKGDRIERHWHTKPSPLTHMGVAVVTRNAVESWVAVRVSADRQRMDH